MLTRGVMAAAVVLACIGSACAEDDWVYEKVILGGTPQGAPPDDPSQHVDPNTPSSPYAGVGAVKAGGHMGSGALLTPRHVLTAAHVFDTDDNGTSNVTPSQVSFYVNNGPTPTIVDAVAIDLHPQFTGFNNPTVNDDLAIVTLAEAVPAGVPYYPLWSQPVSAGTQTQQVGYGRGGDGVSGYTVSASLTVKRVGANVFDLFEGDDDPPPGNGIAEVWYADFDGPTSATNLFGGLTLGNNVETTLAPGDSGGPSFIDVGGQLYIVGVDTFAFSTTSGPSIPLFGSGCGGMLVEPYLGWIDGIIPEPATAMLLAAGLVGLVLRRKRC